MKESEKEIFEEIIKNEDMYSLHRLFFPKSEIRLTPTQQELVKDIFYARELRISLSAMTRYGKTQTVAIAVCLRMYFESVKVKLIGPLNEQVYEIRDYIGELISQSKYMQSILPTSENTSKKNKIKDEFSKRRVTFINGSEYSIISAQGKAKRLMSKGADIVIVDEACYIDDDAYAKITRMLGDNPKEAMIVEMYNPWFKDCKAYEHSISMRYKTYHIGWEDALQEDRTTKSFIEEQREDLDPIMFKVLYESEFPEESDDSLHIIGNINYCENLDFGIKKEMEQIHKQFKENDFVNKKEKQMLKKITKDYRVVVSCDVAEMGRDLTVIMVGYKYQNKYELHKIYSESKSEPMRLVGKIIDYVRKYSFPEFYTDIKIDAIGIGSGPLSRLREFFTQNKRQFGPVAIEGCKSGNGAIDKDRYRNAKAENNFRLKSIFQEKLISLKNAVEKNKKEYRDLRRELTKMKWELTSSGKKKIVDPDKSPDYNDALVYMVWKAQRSLAYSI